MPKEMERRLRAEAERRGLRGKRRGAYIYGTMRKKARWKPKGER